jgi:hypothetical protein
LSLYFQILSLMLCIPLEWLLLGEIQFLYLRFSGFEILLLAFKELTLRENGY